MAYDNKSQKLATKKIDNINPVPPARLTTTSIRIALLLNEEEQPDPRWRFPIWVAGHGGRAGTLVKRRG